MKPIIKATIPAVAVSGGVAALLFGGSAVSTAFTSQSKYSGSVSAATVAGDVTNGNFSVSGLTPGGPAEPVTLSFNNKGTTAEEAYVQVQNLVVDNDGTGGTPDPADLQFTIALPTGTYPGATSPSSPFVVYSGSDTDAKLAAPGGESLYTFSYGELSAASGQWLDAATITAGKSLTDTVYVGLANTAGNGWNGAKVSVPYTVQFQDTSGVDSGASPTPGDVTNLNGSQQKDDDGYVNPSTSDGVQFETSGGGSDSWNANGTIEVSVPASPSSAYANLQLTDAPSALPSTEPTFDTTYYKAGTPRWLITFTNGDMAWGYGPGLGEGANDWQWSTSTATSGYVPYSTIQSDAAGDTVNGVYIVADTSSGAAYTSTISNISYGSISIANS